MAFGPGSGVRSQSVSIPINADNLVEGNETITILIANVSSNQQFGTTAPVGVIIQDVNGKINTDDYVAKVKSFE